MSIDNIDGHITQNIPYSEVFVEESNGSWASPYLFNAKELDEETGLYYYGARYLDPAGARWLSVDPLWINHPDKTPYNYCLNNPVKMVDPDGRDGYEITFIDKNKKETVSYIWYENRKDDEFEVNSSGESIKFRRLTGDKNAWKEATTIRKANIEGLAVLNSGKNRDDIENDVRLYDGDNSLFTKESKLQNHEKYTNNWGFQTNSGGRKGRLSSDIKLKFYPDKGGQKDVNSIGIVKNSLISHSYEAAMETAERVIYGDDADNDPVYDMHFENAKELLKKLGK